MITVTDIFAGAGGSSSGAIAVPDVEVAIAANHWQLAVDVHNDNHPDTEHAHVDLHLEDPRNFPRTDILWASPECTKWSIANSKAKELSAAMGGDPTLFDDVPEDLQTSDQEEIDRSRLLMFDVLRFIEHHRYRAVVVENVVDVATQAKYARAWEAWRRGLHGLGYDFRVVSLNSMHAQTLGLPAPQSRDRLYIVAWPKGEKAPDLDQMQRPKAWCGRCETVVESRQAWKNGRTVGRYRTQYVYVCGACGTTVEPAWLPASTAIDWSLQGERIGDRARPLSDKTMARIREGLRRYGHQFIVDRRGEYRVRQLGDPLSTVTANETTKGLVLDALHGAPIITTTDDPLRTQTTAYTRSLLIPTEGRDGKDARPDRLPLRTQTTRNELGVLIPSGGTWHEEAYPTGQPMRTVTTRENHGLLVPYYSASETAKPTSNPVGTLTTVDRYALVMRHNNSGRGGSDAGMTTPSSEPFRTITTTGHQSVLEPTTLDPEDCTFRMLEPHEIAAGMSFPLDYRWRGTKRERVRLAGNAVTPPAARDLIGAITETLL